MLLLPVYYSEVKTPFASPFFAINEIIHKPPGYKPRGIDISGVLGRLTVGCLSLAHLYLSGHCRTQNLLMPSLCELEKRLTFATEEHMMLQNPQIHLQMALNDAESSGERPTSPASLREIEEYFRHLITRHVPLSRSIFEDGVCPKHSSVRNDNSRLRPVWLQLSGDLAWSATFGSLTNNLTIAGPGSTANYAAFFLLMWLLWGSQTAYDIKYYTNDWWHRIVFLLQLITYATLSSFTADFDVFWRFRDASNEVFTGNVSGLAGAAMIASVTQAKEFSLQGVSFVMFVNRLLLFFQYVLVEIRRINCRECTSICNECKIKEGIIWPPAKLLARLLAKPFFHGAILVSVFISAMIFLATFLILLLGPLTRATGYIQIFLWIAAMLTEAVGYALSHHRDEGPGHKEEIAKRLANLTVVVLGEGLNSIFAVTKYTVNAVGFGWRTALMLASLGIVLCCMWICYFEGYREQLSGGPIKREGWFLLHLVFHLCLAVVLEGLKNMLLQINLIISMERIREVFLVDDINPNSEASKVVKILEKLGMSWSQFQIDLSVAAAKGEVARKVWYHRFALKVMYTQFQKYKPADDETKYHFDQYTKVDDYVLSDLAESEITKSWGSAFQAVIAGLEKPLYNPTTLLVPIGGAVIVSIAILNLVQRSPKDPYRWGSITTKVTGGIILIILGVAHTSLGQAHNLAETIWRIPVLSIVLSAVVAAEFMWLHLAHKHFGKLMEKIKSDTYPISGVPNRDSVPNAYHTKTISESQIEVATPEKSKELLA